MPKLYRAALATVLVLHVTMIVAIGEGQTRAAQPVPTFTRDVSNPDATAEVRWGDQTWEEMQYTGFIYSVAPAASTTAPRP